MKMYQIEEIKEFMELLFLTEKFDKFCVSTIELKTLVAISIQGNLLHDWLGEEDRERYAGTEYVPWKLIRPMVFSLIKGRQTPKLMRIQFVHPVENGDYGGLRIQFMNNELTCISSYSSANFSLDKGKEQIWDEQCHAFFHKNQIVSTLI